MERLARLLLGRLGAGLEALAWLVVALYLAPLALGVVLFWPPRLGGLPFDPVWVAAWTLGQAAASATVAVLVGAPLGALAGFYRCRAARAAVVASLAPFMTPVVVAALGLRAAYGDGPLGFLARGWSGVVAVNSYFNIGLAAALAAASSWDVEASVVEQARLLGLRGWLLWRHLVLPAAFRGAVRAWLLAFLYSVTSASPLLVEGAAYRYYTLEAWLYTLYYGFPSLHGAVAVLAALEVVGVAALGAAVSRLLRLPAAAPAAARGAGLIPLRGAPRLLAAAYSLLVLAYLYAPLAALAREAAGASIEDLVAASEALGTGLHVALANSVAYASIAAAAGVLLGLAAALRGSLAAATLSTVAVAPVAYGVAATLLYFHVLAPLVGAEATSRMLIVLAHLAAALPLAGKALETGVSRIPREVVENAALLGLRGLGFARGLLAAARGAASAAAGLSAAASLGEFGATLVVSVPGTASLTVLVYELMGSGRFFREACLAALILEAMSLGVLAAAYGLPLLAASSSAAARRSPEPTAAR